MVHIMTTLMAAKNQKFLVSGFITLPIAAKKKFFNNEILKLEADIIVGKDSHLLIADEDIVVTWESTNSSNVIGTLSMPILFHTWNDSAEEAIAYAHNMLNNKVDKVISTLTMYNLKKRKFVAENNIQVEWSLASLAN